MIEYVYIRDKSTRNIIGLIDDAKSIIWHSTYYGVGDFEIYAIATETNAELLAEDNYVTRPDNDEVGIIERVETTNSIDSGTMIIASGRFAKSVLDRRQIYKLSGKTNTPTILSGNVEVNIRSLVTNNAINCTFDVRRNISYLELGTLSNITKIIVDETGTATTKQVSYKNLFDYSEEVLKEYKMAAKMLLDDTSYKLQYKVYEGADRSVNNTDGNEPIIFSQEYDNLTDSSYSSNLATKKTSALIGGAGEGLERFYSVILGDETGIDRRETWVDASSLNKTYKDENNQEQEYTDSQYKAMLDALGKQELAALTEEEAYNASVNVNAGQWKLGVDYFLGDVVSFQDNVLGKYADVRIIELTEVQDENGYSIAQVFEFENAEVATPAMVFLTAENNAELLTESNLMMLTESSNSGSALNPSSYGVKISELDEAASVNDLCCFPIVNNGVTKKVTFSTLMGDERTVNASDWTYITNWYNNN